MQTGIIDVPMMAVGRGLAVGCIAYLLIIGSPG